MSVESLHRDLKAAEAARQRLRGFIKRTPIVEAWLPMVSGEIAPIHLKLENLQVAGRSHARGVLNAVLCQPKTKVARGLITAVGRENHAAAVAYAGWLLGFPSLIYLPRGAALPELLQRLEDWNASVVVCGRTWDDAYAAALRRALHDDMAYIHPFDDPSLVAGYSTLGLELLDSLPDLDVLVINASGGGPQLQGVAQVVKHLRPNIRIVGVKGACAQCLQEAGRSCLAAAYESDSPDGQMRAARANLELVSRFVDDIVLVTCEDVDYALHALWSELEVGASVVGASAVAAVLSGKVQLGARGKVLAVVGVMGQQGLF